MLSCPQDVECQVYWHHPFLSRGWEPFDRSFPNDLLKCLLSTLLKSSTINLFEIHLPRRRHMWVTINLRTVQNPYRPQTCRRSSPSSYFPPWGKSLKGSGWRDKGEISLRLLMPFDGHFGNTPTCGVRRLPVGFLRLIRRVSTPHLDGPEEDEGRTSESSSCPSGIFGLPNTSYPDLSEPQIFTPSV